MADTQSILSQRFLETDGELGRSFTKAFGRFSEVHAALAQAQAQATTAVGDSSDAVATPAPSVSPAGDLFQSLLRELASYEHAVRHCALIQANSRVEMRNYQTRELEVSAHIQSVHASLHTLQGELERARQRRLELEEYEALTKKILALPSRKETQAAIEKLNAAQAQLQQDRQALVADMSGKQTKYRAVVASLGQVSVDWTLAEADEAALAAQLAAKEAEVERQRAKEEAAMEEAALQARLDKGDEEEEKEDEEIAKEDAGENAGDLEEGESPPEEGEVKKDAPMTDIGISEAGSMDVEPPSSGARSATPAAATTGGSVPTTPVASPPHVERSGTETPTPMDVQNE